tara:strand:- start:519 stop:671 length:153 start_codon:yes stop_codon:yes gene_type:complete
MDNINELKVKSHRYGEAYTLKELLERIEILEERQSDISYFLNNPRKLNVY